MVQIITDSAADFNPDELEKLKITCIPLPVRFGQTEYYENVDLSKSRFFDLLLHSEEMPKTSQASPEILAKLFAAAHDRGEEALYITISSAISGTYQTACMTRDSMGCEGCYVVDSLNATGGQRLIVQHAVKLRDEGKSAAEIIAGIEDIRGRIVLYACIDTLEYLYKGGRISHSAYRLGTMVNIKPIITVERDGSVGIPMKAMGMRRGMDALCKYLAQTDPDPDFPLYAMYTDTRSVAETLAQRMGEGGHPVTDDRIIQVGAAIGAHIGPNACGLVYVGKK